MSETKSLFLIDAGNTSIKVGIIQNGQLTDVKRFNHDSTLEFRALNEQFNPEIGVISSVISDPVLNDWEGELNQSFRVNSEINTPIKSKYNTQETLGVDRLCNANAMLPYLKTTIGICIDVGTCIKFDIINDQAEYLGGSISPGIDLRYKSLNDYTGKLPLLSNKTPLPLVGKDTNTSIRSGVMNGIQAELNAFISSYEEAYDSLTFFVTGGDAKHFDLHSKNDIFADDNLTLKGLYEIYKHNA